MADCSKYVGIQSSETYLDYNYRPSCGNPRKGLELFDSGILDTSSAYDELAKKEGFAFVDQFTNGLEHISSCTYNKESGNSGVSYVPDLTNPDGDCTPCDSILSTSERWTKHYREKCFKENDLVDLIKKCDTNADEGSIIEDGISKFWQLEIQRIVLAQALGVINSDLAGDSVVSYDACANPVAICGGGTDSNLSDITILEAASTCSNDTSDYSGIIVHGLQYNDLRQRRLVQYEEHCCPDTGKNIRTGFIDGIKIIPVYDPSLIVDAGAGSFLNILFKDGAVAFGRGCAPMPYYGDYDRCLRSHTHTYQEELLIHPKGVCENYRPTALEIPTEANLIDPASYTIGADPSCVGIAGLITCCA